MESKFKGEIKYRNLKFNRSYDHDRDRFVVLIKMMFEITVYTLFFVRCMQNRIKHAEIHK